MEPTSRAKRRGRRSASNFAWQYEERPVPPMVTASLTSPGNAGRRAAHRQGTRPAREQGKPTCQRRIRRRLTPSNVRALHCTADSNTQLRAEAKARGVADIFTSVRRAIEENRCTPSMCPVVKRVHRRFSGRGRRGILRPLRRSDPVAPLPPRAWLCRASPERA